MLYDHKIKLRLKRLNANGEAPLYVIVNNRGRYVWVSTKLFIDPFYWDDRACGLKTTCPNYAKLAPQITAIRYETEMHLQWLRAEYRPFDARPLKKKLKDLESRKAVSILDQRVPTWSEVTADYLLLENLSHGRHKLYQVLANFINEFRPKCLITEVDYRFMRAFHQWLSKTKGNCDNTIYNKMKLVKAIVHHAVNEKMIAEDPTVRYKIKHIQSRRVALTISELNLLQQMFDSEKTDEQFKPLLRYFLFACYTGLRYAQIQALRISDIVDGYIRIRIRKTKKLLDIPLIDKAARLIHVQPGGELFRTHYNHKANQLLKELADAAGIRKHLTFHVSRHTFATTSLSIGIPIKVVSELLGHSSVKVTEAYIHLFNEVKQAEMSKWETLSSRSQQWEPTALSWRDGKQDRQAS